MLAAATARKGTYLWIIGGALWGRTFTHSRITVTQKKFLYMQVGDVLEKKVEMFLALPLIALIH